MTQLTPEEKEMIEAVRNNPKGKIWYGDFIAIIDRLSARVEELESFNTIKGGISCGVLQAEKYCELSARVEEVEKETEEAKRGRNVALKTIGILQSQLSSLLSAVEPFEKLDKANWDKDMGMCPTWREDIKPTDLHNLSTVAAGIRGGK